MTFVWPLGYECKIKCRLLINVCIENESFSVSIGHIDAFIWGRVALGILGVKRGVLLRRILIFLNDQTDPWTHDESKTLDISLQRSQRIT